MLLFVLPQQIYWVLIYLFSMKMGWFPVQGYTPIAEGIGPWLSNLVLPAISLGCVYIALIARITRRSRDHLHVMPGTPLWAQIKAVALLG